MRYITFNQDGTVLGHYNTADHGARRINIDDPTWKRPVIDGTNEPDYNLAAPQIEIDNPDCKIPSGAIEISDDDYRICMANNGRIKRINGAYVVDQPAAETAAEALSRAIVDIRKQRAPIMFTLDGMASRAFRSGEADVVAACDTAVRQLKDITALPAFVAAETYDDMKSAIMARYREIAAATPDSVQIAFREVLG